MEEKLGDKYNIEVFPSELLGSQNEMVQLTQTGAIHFCVASNSLLETFSKDYSIFNLPYLFASSEAYHAAMDDESITEPIFESTKQAGFEAVTWIDAGTRNFYTVSRPVNSPDDLKGLKIRTQQSPTNVGNDAPARRLGHAHGLWRGIHRAPVQGHRRCGEQRNGPDR